MARNFLSGLFGGKPRRDDAEAPDAHDAGNLPPTSPPIAPAAQPADAPTADGAETPKPEAPKPGFFARLAGGLARSSARLTDGVAALFVKKRLDAATLEELEELLIAADLGAPAAARVVAALAANRFDKDVTDADVRAALADTVARTLAPHEAPLAIDPARRPFVALMTGVNGSGKTTTIGKLAALYGAQGMKVMIAAGDTFRAAAIEQLAVWGERAGAEVIARPAGSDAAGLAFEALEKAKAAGADLLLIDTAGRLQNKRELMDELAKIVRVLKKIDPDAPHATLLVLDATVGQNALSQAAAFGEIAGVTGLIMTKLDGTARGGILVALAERFALPIHFIGVGEGIDDLQPFRAESFARALAGLDAQSGALPEETAS